MINGQNTPKRGEPYEQPKLRVIELLAEEVLGIGCKTSPGAPGQGISICTAGLCSTQTGS
jgi:hypothetical protein